VPSTPSNVDIDLEGITAVSPRQIWAVGEISTNNKPSRPYSIRWNGKAWSSVKMPDPDTANGIFTHTVAPFGNGQLEAVGEDESPEGNLPVYEHWNGRSWTVVVGSGGGDLESVSSDGKRLWAAGNFGAGSFLPLIQFSQFGK
jgi:hypothetical protein